MTETVCQEQGIMWGSFCQLVSSERLAITLGLLGQFKLLLSNLELIRAVP
jgi:hypothetical protein